MHVTRYTSYLSVLFLALFSLSCGTIDVFEKNVSIPRHEWSKDFTPEISFEIQDTSALYNIFVVLRHTDAYRYNNIWLNLSLNMPNDTSFTQRLDLRLATDDKGWLGSGMDNIFEHRLLINKESPLQFKTPGLYTFRVEQLMREEPLMYVMNVGIRVEKQQPR